MIIRDTLLRFFILEIEKKSKGEIFPYWRYTRISIPTIKHPNRVILTLKFVSQEMKRENIIM